MVRELRGLQAGDTVLRARQQHDRVVRGLQERHKDELETLRGELSTVTARLQASCQRT